MLQMLLHGDVYFVFSLSSEAVLDILLLTMTRNDHPVSTELSFAARNPLVLMHVFVDLESSRVHGEVLILNTAINISRDKNILILYFFLK